MYDLSHRVNLQRRQRISVNSALENMDTDTQDLNSIVSFPNLCVKVVISLVTMALVANLSMARSLLVSLLSFVLGGEHVLNICGLFI